MRNKDIVLNKLERIMGKVKYIDSMLGRMSTDEFVNHSKELKDLIVEVRSWVEKEKED